ncbi:putative site-specific recombinase [Oscillibacter valericigenes Sjm18-20]|nr:putative site-specific recombinase [Oscillibacter valericigenes Sjm18-20]
MANVTARKRTDTWEYRFELAPAAGKRKQVSKSGFRTKKDALEAGTKAFAEYNQAGEYFVPSEISFSDYLNIWLDEYCSINVKASTVEAYKKKIEAYICPELGAYRLKALTPSVLQSFLNKKFNQGFSRNTLVVLKSMLSGSLGYAVEPLRYIQYNPASMIKLPLSRARGVVPTRKKERRPVTAEEWSQIMERFPEGHPAHIPLLLAYRCGFRLGEVFGLMWSDVNFDQETITINRQIQISESTKKWTFTAPKYDSYRTITVDRNTLNVLRCERGKQIRARAYYDEYYVINTVQDAAEDIHMDSGSLEVDGTGVPVSMIMVREDGSYIQPRTMQHVARVIHGTYKEGHPVISPDWDFHSLRHTHATTLVEAGVPLAVIQKRLGHAKIEMTEHYTDHVTETMERDFQSKLKSLYS